MILILNRNILGRLIYKMTNDSDVHVFGVDKDKLPGKPMPFFIGQNKTTNKIFSGYKTVKPESKTITIEKGRRIVEEYETLSYKRPKDFKRNDMTVSAFINPPIIWPSKKAFHPGKVISIRIILNDSKFPSTTSFTTVMATIIITQLKNDGSISELKYHTNLSQLKIFITLPIKYYYHNEESTGIIFNSEYNMNKNNSVYHIYQYTIETDKNLKIRDCHYVYVKDHFFKKTFYNNIILKKIVPFEKKNHFAFQFLTKNILDYKGLMDLGIKIGSLCHRNIFKIIKVNRIGIELRKRDRKLIKLQEILASRFNIKLLGKFCMEDYSKLHDNLAKAEKFLKGG